MAAGNSKVQVYLNVPFKEKDQAKALGARFNPENKLWYVPHGVDVTQFARWLLADAAAQEGAGVTPLVAVAVKKNKPKATTSPAVQSTPLPALRPLLPASADPNVPPWEL